MAAKICPSCKEENNPAFAYCWKCNIALDGSGLKNYESGLLQSRNDDVKEASAKVVTFLGGTFSEQFKKRDCPFCGEHNVKGERRYERWEVIAGAISLFVAFPIFILIAVFIWAAREYEFKCFKCGKDWKNTPEELKRYDCA